MQQFPPNEVTHRETISTFLPSKDVTHILSGMENVAMTIRGAGRHLLLANLAPDNRTLISNNIG